MTVGNRPVQPSEARQLPRGTAKRQGRNDRRQTRMPGGVGGAGSIPAPTRLAFVSIGTRAPSLRRYILAD